MRVANWTRVVAELLDGDDVDLGFADVSERQQDTDLNVETVRTSQMFFYCRAGHPLAGRKARTIEDLLEFPWVGPSIPGRVHKALPAVDKPFGLFDAISPARSGRNVFRGEAHRPRGVRHCAAIPFQIEQELNDGLLVKLPVDAPWLSLNYGFIIKRGRALSPAAKAFMEIVREIETGIPQ